MYKKTAGWQGTSDVRVSVCQCQGQGEAKSEEAKRTDPSLLDKKYCHISDVRYVRYFIESVHFLKLG